MRIRAGRRLAAGAAVVAMTVAGLGLTTGNAYAAGPGGVEACPSGSVCLYYNSPNLGWGSFENFSPGQHLYLINYTFAHWANGSGHGKPVYMNAASIVNNTNDIVYVSTSDGKWWPYGPQYAGSLNNTWNNDTEMYS